MASHWGRRKAGQAVLLVANLHRLTACREVIGRAVIAPDGGCLHVLPITPR